MTAPIKNFGPACPKQPRMIHGADYNPEQWLHQPEVLEKDIELMQQSQSTTMSIGIFSWGMYEPREGEFNFEWMDGVIDRLHKGGINVLLATPSGAKPAWLSKAYPEVRMVNVQGVRDPHIGRHNHCRTSPVYREKIGLLNEKLARRYGDHPAVIGWHVSNEYSGDECHCELCYGAFRTWLQNKYESLEKLNLAWWSNFWSHRFNAWEEIAHIDPSVHGMVIDWKRFISDQTVDFFLNEAKPLREISPDLPCMINMMTSYKPLDYWRFAPHVDVVTWDSYPTWGKEAANQKKAVTTAFFQDEAVTTAFFQDEAVTTAFEQDEAMTTAFDQDEAMTTAFNHDTFRSLKGGKPWLLMESTPSGTNWQPIGRSKRPGLHRLSAVQAVAHGSDSVQYFQWRKSRGSSEKFHGAVVDHVGHGNTRTFRDVSEVGSILSNLESVVGSSIDAKVAVIFDWENWWAIDETEGPNNINKRYLERCQAHYKELWKRGIAVDVINMHQDLSSYDLVLAPMLYMTPEPVGKNIEAFVESGGTFVTTYWSGVVDENDLCHLSGFPGPLRKTLGYWTEEHDVMWEDQKNTMTMEPGNALGLEGSYELRDYSDIVHLEGAVPLATYNSDFYAGGAALTENSLGKGKAYTLLARPTDAFLNDFYDKICEQLGLSSPLLKSPPAHVSVTCREDEHHKTLFIMNFSTEERSVEVPCGQDLISGATMSGEVKLKGTEVLILRLTP